MSIRASVYCILTSSKLYTLENDKGCSLFMVLANRELLSTLNSNLRLTTSFYSMARFVNLIINTHGKFSIWNLSKPIPASGGVLSLALEVVLVEESMNGEEALGNSPKGQSVRSENGRCARVFDDQDSFRNIHRSTCFPPGVWRVAG